MVAELGEFLYTDPSVPQRFHRGSGPERPVLLAGEVRALPAAGSSAQIRAVPAAAVACAVAKLAGVAVRASLTRARSAGQDREPFRVC